MTPFSCQKFECFIINKSSALIGIAMEPIKGFHTNWNQKNKKADPRFSGYK